MAHNFRFAKNNSRLRMLANGYNTWSARRGSNPQPSESEMRFQLFAGFYKYSQMAIMRALWHSCLLRLIASFSA